MLIFSSFQQFLVLFQLINYLIYFIILNLKKINAFLVQENIPDLEKLTQEVFEGQTDDIVVACVDYDGTLKLGTSKHVRYTWAFERWRGSDWIHSLENSKFTPITMLLRK